jgi:putative Mn2+ efflux pump MntP
LGLLELLLLAVGLAMDAFAVSICGSLALAPASRFSGALRFGIWFGFFQALMPVVGFFCAIRFRSYIETYDHWIAFILLIYLGINMLREADAADSCNLKQHYNIREMLTLAVATSIDALAVGVSFAFLDVDIWTAAGLIGLVTFIFSMFGWLQVRREDRQQSYVSGRLCPYHYWDEDSFGTYRLAVIYNFER